MIKKAFLGIAVITLLFIAGCSFDISSTNKEELNALPGPSGLTANTAYDGVVILTWNVVPNAYGYKIIRYDPVTKVSIVCTQSTFGLYFFDWVSWDNQMENGRSYEYTVISQSFLSSEGTDNAGGQVVQNGSSSVSAKPKIPEAFVPALAEADVSLIDNNENGLLYVKIKNIPNLNYEVAYTYGENQTIVRDLENLNASNIYGEWFDPYKVMTYPIVGGVNTVTVKATFIGGTGYYSGTSAPISKKTASLTGNLYVSEPSFLSAGTNLNYISLSWDDVSDAAKYYIYRAEVSASTSSAIVSSTWSGYEYTTIKVLSDWTAVTATQDLINTTWSAFDPVTAVDKYYIYAIVAEGNNGAKSRPRFAVAQPLSVSAPALTINHKDNNVNNKEIQLIWNAESNTTYKLQYAEVVSTVEGQEANSSNYRVVGDYSDIPLTAANYLQAGTGVANKNDLTVGKNYIFKITATRGGVTSNPAVEFLTSGPFQTTVNFILSRSNPVYNQAANSIVLEINDNNTYRGVDYQFDLYRRVTTTGKETAYVAVTLPSEKKTYAADPDNSSPSSWTFTDTGLDVTLAYRYKLVTSDYINSHTNNGQTTSAGVRPHGYSFSGNTYFLSAYVDVATVVFGTTNRPARSMFVGNSIGYSGASGPNCVGLSVAIEYESTGGTKTANVAITRLTDSSANPAVYYYYIVLPSDVEESSNYITLQRYPWSDSDEFISWGWW